MSDDTTRTTVKLDENNYGHWSLIMEAVLTQAKVWMVVGPPDGEAGHFKGEKGAKERKRKQEVAKAKIVLSLDVSQLAFVAGLGDPRVIWNTLESIHRSGAINSILTLRRRFFRMVMQPNESAMAWIARVRAQAFELSQTPYPVIDIDIILVITDGLPPSFNPVVTALDALTTSELTIKNVQTRVISHQVLLDREQQKDRSEDTTASSVAFAAAFKRPSTSGPLICYNCGGHGHIASKCPSPPTSKHAEEALGVFGEDSDEDIVL